MFIIKLLITDSIEIDMNEQVISIFDGINLTTLIDNQNNVMGITLIDNLNNVMGYNFD